jgi:hypothetical protein
MKFKLLWLLFYVLLPHLYSSETDTYVHTDHEVQGGPISLTPPRKRLHAGQDVRIIVGYEKGFRKLFHHAEKKYGKTCSIFTCSSCSHMPTDGSNIVMHLHNQCFPEKGVSCIHCMIDKVPCEPLLNLRQIVEHNVEKHMNLKYWRCGVCDVNIPISDFYKHFKNSTYKQKRDERLHLSLEEFKARIGVMPSLNTWHWKSPVLQENRKRKLIDSDFNSVVSKYPDFFPFVQTSLQQKNN